MRAIAVIFGTCLVGCSLVLGLKDPGPETNATDDGAVPGPDPNDQKGGTPNACDADFARDPLNCGRCGHDCQGGECDDGKCKPVVLATENDPPRGIGVNAEGVFWLTEADAGALRTCSLPTCDGGAKTMNTGPIQAGRDQGPIVSPNDAYWLSGPFLVRCSTQGCGAGPTLLLEPGRSSTLARSRGGTLQLTTGGADLSSDLVGCRMPNCANSVTLAREVHGPNAMVSDGRFFYWSTLKGAEPVDVIERCSLADCRPEEIAINALATDLDLDPSGSTLFWTGNQLLQKCRLPACNDTIETLYAGEATIFDLASDETDVYFTQERGVFRCAVAGCKGAPTKVDASRGDKWGLALDATSIYWTNRTDRTVMKLAK